MERTDAIVSRKCRSTSIGTKSIFHLNFIFVFVFLQQIISLKSQVEQFQMEKRSMTQFQEEMLDRIKKDLEAKNQSAEENLLNTKLQQSVEELNVRRTIDCVDDEDGRFNVDFSSEYN